MANHILSIILFTPLVGAILLLFMPRENKDAIRWVANIFAFAGFAVSVPLVPMFWAVKEAPGFKFLEGAPQNWIPSIGAGYYLGIDGISLSADHADHAAGRGSPSCRRGPRLKTG